MSSNTLKKMIIFSSEEKKLFVEKMIADECLIKDKSASKCIEEHLLNSLLSEDKNIRDQTRCYKVFDIIFKRIHSFRLHYFLN